MKSSHSVDDVLATPVRRLLTLATVLSWLVMMGLLVHKQAPPPSVMDAALPAAGLIERDDWFGVLRDGKRVGRTHRVTTRMAFYYHAWTELWLGAWVTADAVFRQLPADATHVKPIEGGPDRHLELAGIVGELAFTAEESAL